jgi:RNA polymerase sigma factor (sigma-70 family)
VKDAQFAMLTAVLSPDEISALRDTNPASCAPVPDVISDAERTEVPRVAERGVRTFIDVYQSRYREMVQVARLTTGSHALAEELVQDAFAELYRRFDTVRKPDAYLQRAVISRSTSWLRRRIVERRHLDRQRPEPAWSNDPDTLAVLEAVDLLSPRQRAAVVLRYLVDWSEADVANALGCRPAAVRSLLARARTQLAKELSHDH